jgi:hypothetical protein
MAYDDGRVACTDHGLVIRHYYFPVGPKRIAYSKLQQVRRVPLKSMGSPVKIHGSADFIHWFNFDPHRSRKDVALILALSGSRIRPVITPDDADSVAAELAAHGVHVINWPNA